MIEVAPATTNPALGVLIFALGGLAGAVFYLPFKKVKNWAWESYWMIYAVCGLVIVPWVLALSTSPNLLKVLQHSPGTQLFYCFACGAMWGVGGLTWGLMIRYLGVGLGLAIGCGLCSAAGTLIPPIFLAAKREVLLHTAAGYASLVGVLVSLAGIVLVGAAGMSKEKELPEAEKKKAVAEFNFRKGLLVAIFSGLMSSGMNFGLQGGPVLEAKAQFGSETTIVQKAVAGKTIEAPVPKAAIGETTTSQTWKGAPVLVVVLLGGFLVNFAWCLYLNFKNKTIGDYTKAGTPLLCNLVFAGLAGAIWCSQFICLKTGEPAMGRTAYVGWAVLMAGAILFSTLLGILLGEWKGTSCRTRSLLAAGLVFLVLSSIVAGYSGRLGQETQPQQPQATASSLLRS
jgi:L-rhamnose-H+ transport protein